jgi:hypothetical protein
LQRSKIKLNNLIRSLFNSRADVLANQSGGLPGHLLARVASHLD